MTRKPVIFVDVDDTLVRSFGSKRIPMSSVIEHVRGLRADGAVLYCWSSGGADYARASAEELGLGDCFVGFLPKPDGMLDDQPIADWRNLVHMYPGQVPGRTVLDYCSPLHGGGGKP